MIYIPAVNTTTNEELWECPRCDRVFSEAQLFSMFDGNEDDVQIALAFDYCPSCTEDMCGYEVGG